MRFLALKLLLTASLPDVSHGEALGLCAQAPFLKSGLLQMGTLQNNTMPVGAPESLRPISNLDHMEPGHIGQTAS